MSITRRTLRQRMGRTGFCGDLVTGTTTTSGNASFTTLVDSSLPDTDDIYNNGQVVITSGTCENQRRFITDYTGSSGTVTVFSNKAFTNTILNSVTYEIHRIWSADEKDYAINEAIQLAGKHWTRKIEDTSITTTSADFTYDVTNLTVALDQTLLIDKVEVETDTANTSAMYTELQNWYIRNNNGSLTLQFRDMDYVGDVRLTYRTRPPVFTADTSTGGVLLPDDEGFATFVVAVATGLLFQRYANTGGEKESEHWQMMADKMLNPYRPIIYAIQSTPMNEKVRYNTWV